MNAPGENPNTLIHSKFPDTTEYGAWSFADQEGRFVGQTFSGPAHALRVPEGLRAVPGRHDHLSRRLNVETGEVVDWQPPKPQATEFIDFTWNEDTRRWEQFPTLAAYRRGMDDAINRVRDQKFAERAVTSTGIAFRIAADRDNLTAVLNTRAAGKAASNRKTKWRDADNKDHMLDQAGLEQLAVEMGLRGEALFEHSWTLKARVAAATSVEEIQSVDIDNGWP